MDAKANTHICETPITQPCVIERTDFTSAAYLIMIRGGMPGTMLRVEEEGTTLGRSSENTFPFHDPTVSRYHATVRLDGGGSVAITDEQSTNGTFVNGRRIEPHREARLGEGDRIQLGTGVILKLVYLDPSDERFQHEMFERTVRDGMTGLYNRGYFLNQVSGLSARQASQGIGLAVLMLDVDHFKQINDRYGHLAGDCVLREVAQVIRESTRPEDLVARYGGEEFVVALPVSAPDIATERAERIRSSLEGRPIYAAGDEVRVTVSIGLAFGQPGRPLSELVLIEAADQALYQAKADGRNRVVLGRSPRKTETVETESAEFLTSLKP
jgi:two-component system, cell cycle response regulator